MISRRKFFKLTAATGVGLAVAGSAPGSAARRIGALRAYAVALGTGLSDPALEAKFVTPVPDAMSNGFKYTGGLINTPTAVTVGVGPSTWTTGHSAGPTPIWGYGTAGDFYSWPGRTFEVMSGVPLTVTWQNNLTVDGQPGSAPITQYLLTSLAGDSVVDESLHWAYSVTPGSIDPDGVPIVTHVHGGHSDSGFDGNPEYFFNPDGTVLGPRYTTNTYTYQNDQVAGTVWYHDHALGITRLNVYAGMAGFYIIRDGNDTGDSTNPLGLPYWPYEKAYAIQDRMFKTNGELFYPAFAGDPFWADFITATGATPPIPGGPSALAEFFGDHMLANGVLWPKEEVEPRNYRLRLLNGCDSRFLGVQFRSVPAGATDLANAGAPIPFWVIGSDQGLAFKSTQAATLVIGPGERYDIVFDFSQVPMGSRVIMENIGGDAPFGGQLVGPGFPAANLFPNRQTDRIMAFDVVKAFGTDDPGQPDIFNQKNIQVYQKDKTKPDRIRKVALFEGMDEYGRLQPLLGTAEPATDYLGTPIMDPFNPGVQLEGAMAWHYPTTENPALGSTEVWEIYNATPDAHPVHLHLVHFEVLERQKFSAKLVPQPVVQHNMNVGTAFRLQNINLQGKPVPSDGVERAPKDMVTALPGEVTRIKAKFDKPGRYVWHCHILSHEDHEMMRVLHVGPEPQPPGP